MAGQRFLGALAAVGLFFCMGVGAPGGEPAATMPEAEEYRVAVETLRARLRALEEQNRSLGESLAIARTESELFQRRWAEAQLKAQTLGADLGSRGPADPQRQLVESVRALYVVEAERQQLRDQCQRLLDARAAGQDLAAELERLQALLAVRGADAGAAARAGTLAEARVLDVNLALQVVALNVGAGQGVRVGMPFVVLHGEQVVAQVRVVEVRAAISAALVEQVTKGATLTAGDAARATNR